MSCTHSAANRWPLTRAPRCSAAVGGKAPDHRLKTEFGEVFQTFQGARTRFFDAFLGRATAEGLLMYLPASAQEQLCAGIDSLAAPGSGVALEEMQPMHADALEAKRAEERAFPHQPSTFFNLIYHELHRDAAAWFGEHGWDAQATLVANYFVQLGRPLPEPDTDAGQMLNSSSLVTAKKL